MEEIRRRLQIIEDDQREHFTHLSELGSNVQTTKTELKYLREDIHQTIKALSHLGDTINRWKGGIMLLMVIGPIAGPLLTLLVRWIFFGAPPTKP